MQEATIWSTKVALILSSREAPTTSLAESLSPSRNTSRLIVLRSVCILLSSLQPYVRLRRWQVNLKTIGISSEDERLSTGSLASLVTAVIPKDRLLV
jgi:hypothetical protein